MAVHRGIMSTHLRWLKEAAELLDKAQSKLGDVYEKTPQPWVSERVSVAMERLHDIEYYIASNLIGALENPRGKPSHGHRPRRTRRRAGLLKQMSFFRAHGGGVVGEAAKGALMLARAERTMKQKGWQVELHPEQERYEDVYGEKDPGGDWVTVVLKDAQGNFLGSLGFVDANDSDYVRVVAAELASEVAYKPGGGRYA